MIENIMVIGIVLSFIAVAYILSYRSRKK